MESLAKIQQSLKVPKGQFNKFGGFYYRSLEDILEAVKPHLGKCILYFNDEIVQVGDRFYVRATATLKEGGESISVTAWAREQEVKTKMDQAQLTGATSTYARKYALNSLLALSDGPDPDAISHQPNGQAAAPPPTPVQQQAEQARQQMSETFSQPTHQPQTTAAPATSWPTPTKQQREFMQILVDYYKTQQPPGYTFSKQKLAEHTWANLSRWASSENDVVLVKQYVTALDVMVQTHG